MKRVGLLTSGGDCQALNATMRGVAKGLYNELGGDVEIYGFEEGYKGLIYSNFRMLKAEDFSGILTVGGTILGKGGIFVRAVGMVLGSFVFRLVYTVALRFNMPAFMLKLVSSVIVVLAISGPYLKKQWPQIRRRMTHAKGGR